MMTREVKRKKEGAGLYRMGCRILSRKKEITGGK